MIIMYKFTKFEGKKYVFRMKTDVFRYLPTTQPQKNQTLTNTSLQTPQLSMAAGDDWQVIACHPSLCDAQSSAHVHRFQCPFSLQAVQARAQCSQKAEDRPAAVPQLAKDFAQKDVHEFKASSFQSSRS